MLCQSRSAHVITKLPFHHCRAQQLRCSNSPEPREVSDSVSNGPEPREVSDAVPIIYVAFNNIFRKKDSAWKLFESEAVDSTLLLPASLTASIVAGAHGEQ